MLAESGPRAQLWVDSACHLAESPRWDERFQRLLWVDLTTGDLWRADATGSASRALPWAPVGMLVGREDGGYLVAAPGGLCSLDDAFRTEAFLAVDEDWTRLRWNDGGCDPAGRLLVGSTALEEGTVDGRLYQISADAEVTVVLDGIGMSNGIGWSPDGRVMHLVDTAAQSISSYTYDPTSGSVGRRRGVIHVHPDDGKPDGLAVDADGHLWVALWGGSRVRRYAPDGRCAGEIGVAARYVTSCTFGGPSLRDLYITTARWNLTDAELENEPGAGGVFHSAVATPGTATNRAQITTPTPPPDPGRPRVA